MALSGNDTAILTARAGAARAGAVRAGFCPKDTQGTTPGSSGPFYIWAQIKKATSTVWTTIRS